MNWKIPQEPVCSHTSSAQGSRAEAARGPNHLRPGAALLTELALECLGGLGAESSTVGDRGGCCQLEAGGAHPVVESEDGRGSVSDPRGACYVWSWILTRVCQLRPSSFNYLKMITM